MSSTYGPYELGDKIASGGMASLYIGVHRRLGTKAAIKILPRSLAMDESYIARFEREAMITSRLKHENIVQILDFGKKDDIYYIVMEYVEGTDLRVLLERISRFPVEIAVSILEEAAYGLEAAHGQGVIHRDIKPGNILLSHTGGVKIVDFGLALHMAEYERLTRLTADNFSLGTPAYMSPEQALGREIDHRADIYSLGAMTYELFTGKTPYLSASPSELRERIIHDPPPSMRAESRLVTVEVDDLVRKMMAKDPADRFQNMGEVLRAVDETMVSLEKAGYTVRYRRKYMPRFSRDPEEFSRRQRDDKIEIHNRRGREFFERGPNEYHQARREFEIVLWLDPGNEEAVAGLAEIRKNLGDEATRDVESVFPEPSGDAAENGRDRRGGSTGGEEGGGKWKKPRTVFLGAGAAVILLFLAWRIFFPGGKGYLFVSSDPDGAVVSVRGEKDHGFRSTGLSTPCTIDLGAGKWTIRVNRQGLEVTETNIFLSSGEEKRLDLTLLPLHGWVVLRGEPAGARLLMRGPGDDVYRPAEKAVPCTLRVAQGEWSFVAEKEEYQSETLSVFIRSGEIEYARVGLHPPGAALGWVVIRTEPPDARIGIRRAGDVDFDPVESATPCSLGLEPGSWEISVRKNCYRTDVSEITVDAGDVVRTAVALDAIPGGRLKVVISPLFADIYVDGKRVAREKRFWEGPVSSCRTHDVEIRHDSFGVRRVKNIAVPSGSNVIVDTLFSKERGRGRTK